MIFEMESNIYSAGTAKNSLVDVSVQCMSITEFNFKKIPM